MNTRTDAVATPTSVTPTAPPRSAPDRLMRRLLRISAPITTKSATNAAAHRALRVSLVISGLRCLATYLVVPILIPLVNVAGIVAAPIGIVLCVVAVVNGVVGVRRFWSTDHRSKWLYTWFMVAVFVVLAIALVADINRLVTGT